MRGVFLSNRYVHVHVHVVQSRTYVRYVSFRLLFLCLCFRTLCFWNLLLLVEMGSTFLGVAKNNNPSTYIFTCEKGIGVNEVVTNAHQRVLGAEDTTTQSFAFAFL